MGAPALQVMHIDDATSQIPGIFESSSIAAKAPTRKLPRFLREFTFKTDVSTPSYSEVFSECTFETAIQNPVIAAPYVTRTAIGKRLVELRQQAIEAGMKTLSFEEISTEVARRRGEIK